MMRIPTRTADSYHTRDSEANKPLIDEWDSWYQEGKNKGLMDSHGFTSAPAQDSTVSNDGYSLRQRLQSMTRHLRRGSNSSEIQRRSTVNTFRRNSSSERLSVLSSFVHFARGFVV